MKQSILRNPQVRRAAALALGLFCVALLVHEIWGEHGYMALQRERREFNALRQKNQQLREENQELETRIKALKSDPQAIEKLARERLGLARPGEIVIALPDKNSEAQTPPASAKQPSPK